MEKQQWLLEQLDKIQQKSTDYNQITLVKATKDIINEQVKRIEQMEGELEGTIWSPKRWGE
ncbi:hypothetical protein [Bacillus andreraoultii]|uniref:hypothetical protein n=1 Tax=Bacillus andreraoultii TaxID=1499685 RepID=UPI00053A1DB6|nr:hypothetical protein [Bacillus andreraoultii]